MPHPKYICIHGHFYQPPRENAWLEVIELQDSAAPFHDWNERINDECYAPNTAARILDEEDKIINLLNNYSHISFNFGPTLLSWMEQADPHTYEEILRADQLSQKRFGGHGSAIAQVHSHLILPLCNRRDKETQVIWGIRDFQHRFGRMPEGMWLAETAVDTETLEVLAEQGIRYTILAPRQAKAIRPLGTDDWHPVDEGSVPTHRAYLCKLPSGKEINLFFYHGSLSQGVAFNGFLNNGKYFAEQLLEGFGGWEEPQMVHIATDGESYGHHHRHGEMALASCLQELRQREDVQLVNYGQFLELHPPTYEMEIHEKTSWSCVHGVERWRSDCGCHSGMHGGWHQAWRGPLRDALDWVRDTVMPIFEREAGKLLKDPWKARNDYISVLLNRNDSLVDLFFERHAKHTLSSQERTHCLRLLEMQRHAMLMYTSCGWFFDEISGIETVQILQYANRALYFAWQTGGLDYNNDFIKRLEKAPSNVYPSGADPYLEYVMPARVDLERVGMHYAVASLFADHPEKLKIFNYSAESEWFEREKAGVQRLAIGRTRVRSRITHSEKNFSFAVIYLGQQNIIGNISRDMDPETFDTMQRELIAAFQSTNLGEVIGIMQAYFGPNKYTIWHLFRDEKRKILRRVTEKSFQSAEIAFRDIYNDNYQLMSGMQQSGIPIPDAFLHAVEYILDRDLEKLLEKGKIYNVREIRRLAKEKRKWKVKLKSASAIALLANERIYEELQKLEASVLPIEDLKRLIGFLKELLNLGVEPELWKSQNLYYYMLLGYKQGRWVFASEEWKSVFLELGDLLGVRI
jgi:alpha-amylase/alpha-mannosidase (GH57 family)